MTTPALKSQCCSPTASKAPLAAPASHHGTRHVTPDAVAIPGGRAIVGTNAPRIADDGEAPLRKTQVKPVLMGATTVTNAQFAAFVTATGYITEAAQFGWSFVFHSDVHDSIGPTVGAGSTEWWRKVDGARWDRVDGKTSGPDDHPATHVSWHDARAYADWVGGRLPSEAEWEHAARGGQADVPYPWGIQDPDDKDFLPCNIWQGAFPDNNTEADGYKTTAPAKSFAPNAYGLYNMIGNVWEWTADPYRVKSLKKHVKQRLAVMRGFKVLKGGSFLCHRSYCERYRIAARTGNSPDSTTSHQGFRVIWDIQTSP